MLNPLELDHPFETRLNECKWKVFQVWLSLTNTQFSLVQCEEQEVTKKMKELDLGLGLFSKTLEDYFFCQESVLSSFLDESTISTISDDHRDLVEQVDVIKGLVALLRRSNKDQRAIGIPYVQKSITDIRRRVEEDTIKEELTLRLLKAEGYRRKERQLRVSEN